MERFNYYLRLFEIWLLFPATWFLFYNIDSVDRGENSDTLFYTSVKAPKGSSVDLYKGNIFMAHLDPTGNSYTPLQYQGEIKFTDSLNIQVTRVSEKDTISFLAINVFKKNSVSTFPEKQFYTIASDSATIIDTTNHLLSYVPNKDVHRFSIYLTDPRLWSIPDNAHFKIWIYISTFLFLLLIVFVLKPAHNYLFIVTCMSCAVLSFYWWVGKDTGCQFGLKNNTALKGVTIYHDSMPEFVPDMCDTYLKPDSIFKTQVDLSLYPYYRISFRNETTAINNLSFNYGFGLIRKNWHLRYILPSEIITNDLDYNSRSSTWSVRGNDPYICLTTSTFISSIDKIVFLRKSLFLFISSFIFLIGLFMQPVISGLTVSKTILISAFITIIFNSLFFWFFNSDKLKLDSEKRLAERSPIYDSLALTDYTKKSGLFMQDQLPGRNNLIISNNLIKYELFGQVPGNPLVYFGKDGWMFYTGDSTREMYENKHPLTPEQLAKMKNVLVGRRDWLKKRNIHYYILFPRLSHFIYNEKIGSGLNVYNPKPKLIQLLEYLKQNTDLDIIDMEKPILDAKAKYKYNLYYPNDSHWTTFGGYFAYRAIIDYIRRDFPNMPKPIPYEKIKWVPASDNNGDLAQLLCLNTVIKRHDYVPVNRRFANFTKLKAPNYPEFPAVHPMLFYMSKDTLAPKLIMFRDSYSNALIPYFSTNFSRQGYLWTPSFYPTIIEKEKPDLVITEISERAIYELLKDTPLHE